MDNILIHEQRTQYSVEKTSEMFKQTFQTHLTRVHYLDNLKVFLTVLVVLHHTAITYGAYGSWYYYATYLEGSNDPLTSILLTIVTAINSSFFMAAFFLLSGYFTPGSYNRKGSVVYLKDRFIRLGIPFLSFVTIIIPLLIYYRNFTVFGVEYSLLEFYTLLLKKGIILNAGPLWFVQALLILAICYTIWRVLTSTERFKTILVSQEHYQNYVPSIKQIFLVIALVGLLTFLVRIFIPSDSPVELISPIIFYLPLGDFISYVSMFILGIVAYQQNWLSRISESQGKFWLKVVLGSIIILIGFIFLTGAFEDDISVYLGGFSWESLLWSIWGSINCFAICISLIPIFRKKFNDQNTFTRMLSQNAYTVYIIHAPVLVVTSISLSGIILHPLVKFIGILGITLILCFGLSHLVIRRIPGAKRVVG
ncbi:MAG: acyltransferase family protein, partial [Promethearchaeota archaeon]